MSFGRCERLTGLEKSPDPFAVAGVLGKRETIKD